MATAKEFVEFWLQNSVHADEQFGARRGRVEVDQLVDNLVRAAEAQGFTRQQLDFIPKPLITLTAGRNCLPKMTA